MNGLNTSKSTWKVVLSRPSARTARMTRLATKPSTRPMPMPPKKLARKLVDASMMENRPVAAAAMANWNDTIPEASLMSDSPLRMLC